MTRGKVIQKRYLYYCSFSLLVFSILCWFNPSFSVSAFLKSKISINRKKTDNQILHFPEHFGYLLSWVNEIWYTIIAHCALFNTIFQDSANVFYIHKSQESYLEIPLMRNQYPCFEALSVSEVLKHGVLSYKK